MSYTRVIQAGDYVEVYEYTKRKPENVGAKGHSSRARKRRSSAYYRESGVATVRRASSIRRAKKNFFRLVSANLQGTEKPAFITLTLTKEYSLRLGYKFLQYFFKNLKRVKGDLVRYIAVPEWQEDSGFLHFHCLVWGTQEEDIQREDFDRDRRNYQRQWLRGYVDVRYAKYLSLGIAGYMAKYMAKASADSRLLNQRAYTHSGNCFKYHSQATNTLSDYLGDIVGEEGVDISLSRIVEYDTMWYGRCTYKQYKKLQ